MGKHTVIVFQPYPFEIGQKIHIDGGPRHGDWEVVGITERKVKLRCPVTLHEVEWDKFCYLSEERDHTEWPQHD